MTNREGIRYATKAVVSVAIGMALAACTSSQGTSGEPSGSNYTNAQVEQIRQEARLAGYAAGHAAGLKDGRKEAGSFGSSAWNRAYATGMEFICREVFGSGPTNADGWRVHVDGNGDFMANKASVWWWLIGYAGEVPTPFTAKECLSGARDQRDGIIGNGP